MQLLQQLLFAALTITGFYLFAKKLLEIRRNILLGKPLDIHDNKQARLQNLILNAFGQKKMFNNPLVGVLHFFVYVGFIIINIELLEIIIDGLTGHHRIFSPILGGLYTFFINSFEFLAVSVLIAVIIFLARRHVVKVKRLNSGELSQGWPRKDATIILMFEVVLMSLFLIMNATDACLQDLGAEHYSASGSFFFSGLLKPLFSTLPSTALIFIERTCWWAHIIGIYLFMNYLP
ncbi:MAG TPA: hypothetical protein PLU10_12185 [Chitinophagaceae bacterium]|nr:hypothetical protein [Chitinophagaceae bacterium]